MRLPCVQHQTGALLQENAYYPYGLPIEPLSSYAAIKTANKALYQSKLLEEEMGLNWYYFDARYYDAQIGRFASMDPAMQFANGYNGMGGNPVMTGDPDGRVVWFAPILIGAVIGGTLNLVTKAAQGQIGSWGDGFKAFGVGAVAGAVGAATGGAAFAAAGGAAGGAGGFLAGAAGGLAGAAVSSPVLGFGNQTFFGDPYSLSNFGKDLLMGGLTGGLVNGGIAALRGNNFWSGSKGIGNLFRFDNQRALLDAGWRRSPVSGKWVKTSLIIQDRFNGVIDEGGNLLESFAGRRIGDVLDDGVSGGTRTGINITYQTKAGKYPSWSTVKSRYWNLMNGGKVPTGSAQVRMRATGEIRTINVSKELHHINGRTAVDPHRFSNLKAVWPWEHGAIDPSRFTGYDFIQWVK